MISVFIRRENSDTCKHTLRRMAQLKQWLEWQWVCRNNDLREIHIHYLSHGVHIMHISTALEWPSRSQPPQSTSRCPSTCCNFLQLSGHCGHYLPEAPSLLAPFLWYGRILREAVKFLQVIDYKLPLNGEFLSQFQSREVTNDQHLGREKTLVTNQVTQSYGDIVLADGGEVRTGLFLQYHLRILGTCLIHNPLEPPWMYVLRSSLGEWITA